MAHATDELASARVLIDTGHPRTALFLCQQAAEKSLKAFLTWHGRLFPWTHDLDEIGRLPGELDGTVTPLVGEADVLSDYAWRLRYPGTPYPADPDEAERMFALASRVLQEIQSRLPL